MYYWIWKTWLNVNVKFKGTRCTCRRQLSGQMETLQYRSHLDAKFLMDSLTLLIQLLMADKIGLWLTMMPSDWQTLASRTFKTALTAKLWCVWVINVVAEHWWQWKTIGQSCISLDRQTQKPWRTNVGER